MSPTIPIKQINRNQIYRYIYKHTKVSQQDISSDLKLSMPTINQNLNALRSMGLISDQDTFESTGGRKARAISCVKDARISIGLDITANHVSLVAIDMYANILHYNRIRHRYTDSFYYYATLGKLIRSFIERNEIDEKKILGLGICLAAIIDEDGRTIRSARCLGAPADLYEKLKPHIPFPFRLINDANAGGFAQWWDMEQDRTIIFLNLSNTVGGAMVNNRKLYLGDHQRSCEFGHVTLVPDGKPCYCGQKGCVNAYCSAKNLSDMTDGKMSLFFEYVKDEQEPYLSAFREYLGYLAITVNNLRMQYDCDIVLGGYVGSYLTDHLELIRSMVSARSRFEEPEPYIFTSKYLFETAAIGAALYYIDRFIRCI